MASSFLGVFPMLFQLADDPLHGSSGRPWRRRPFNNLLLLLYASNNHVRVADFLLLRHAMHAHHSLTLSIYISAHAGTAQRRTHAGRLGRGK